MEVLRHQLAFELALVNGALHRIREVMRHVRSLGTIDDQRQSTGTAIDADDPDVLSSATEEPRRFDETKSRCHAALIGICDTVFSRRTVSRPDPFRRRAAVPADDVNRKALPAS